jgi:hypothetical protein
MRFVVAAALLIAAIAAAGGAARQPEVEQSPKAAGHAFADRLEQLGPQDPLSYFLLAEEVADTAVNPADFELAKQLYVLAFHYDRVPGRAATLSASAVLGLAEIERLDRDRRWLLALAGSLDKRYAQPDWNVPASGSISDETAAKAAAAIGLARSGDGRESRKLLEDTSVMEVLRRYERAIGTTGETGALSRIAKYSQQWPCPECGNARVVTKPTERGPELRLCGTCRGNPGPKLGQDEIIAQLRFESYLLNGIQRSWAAQSIVDQGAPLRDPSAEELAETMGVDASKPYWRKGAWVDRP